MPPPFRVLTLISSLILLFPLVASGQELNFEKIVRRGDPVPEQPGQLFTQIFAIDYDEGRVLFRSDFDCGDCEGIYLYDGSLRKVADTDTIAPGTSEEDFKNFFTTITSLSESHVLFSALYEILGAGGIYSAQVDSLVLEEVTLRENLIPEGTGKFGSLRDGDLSGSTLAFYGEGENDQEGIYTFDFQRNRIAKIADLNDTVPGDPLGRTFRSVSRPIIKGDSVLFFGESTVDTENDTLRGLYLFENSSLTRVMDDEMPRPGNENLTIGSPSVYFLEDGMIYFRAGGGIYVWDQGTIDLIVERNMQDPNSARRFNDVGLIGVSEGTVVFSDRPSFGDDRYVYIYKDGAIADLYTNTVPVNGEMPDGLSPLYIDGTNVFFRASFGGSDAGYYVADVSAFVGVPPDPTPTSTPVPVLPPDLTVQINPVEIEHHQTQVGTDFVCGNPGIFRVVVTNLGEGPTTGPITVEVELPTEVTYRDLNEEMDGWECEIAGQKVTCSRTEPLGISNPFSTEILIPIIVSATAPAQISADVSVETLNDSNPSNDSGFVFASVGPPPIRATIVSPRQNGSVVLGTKPRLTVRIDGPNRDYHLNGYEISWDGGPMFRGTTGPVPKSSGIDGDLTWSFALPKIPNTLPEGQPIAFSLTLFDGFSILSKPVTVSTSAKEPVPPEIRFYNPVSNETFTGNSTEGIEIPILARVKVEHGIDPNKTLIDLTSSSIDTGLVRFRDLSYSIPERNAEGFVTKCFISFVAFIRPEDFNQSIPTGEHGGEVRIVVEDRIGNAVGRDVEIKMINPGKDVGPPPSSPKGTNTTDASSQIIDSLVTGSTLEKSIVVGATVENSTIRSSILLPVVQVSNAEIDFGVVLSGTVSKDGETLTPPALLSDLYEQGVSGHVLSTVLTGDSNRDGLVETGDRFGVANDWYENSEAFDLNLDETVDPTDLLNLLDYWKD